jgi:hypothetical protein
LSLDLIGDDGMCNFLETYIPSQKLILTIDRTIWEFGKTIRNILVLAVSYKNIAMPLLFKIIPYKGSCTGEDQIELVEKFVGRFGIDRIEVILGDREFDGENFITYLNSMKIGYALRVRKTNRIINGAGERERISSLDDLIMRHYETKFYKIDVKFDHLKLSEGDYLSLVSNRSCEDALAQYRRRWDIECAFKGCKTSGFRIEETHIKNPKRFENFVKCFFIAYAISIKAGYMQDKKVPIKFKKTLSSNEISILQYGFKILKETYCKSRKLFQSLVNKVLNYTFPLNNKIFVR